MPRPAGVLKIVPFGNINGIQSWSTGVWLLPEFSGGAWGPSELADVLTAMEDPFATWWTFVAIQNRSTCHFTGLRGYFYGAAGGGATVVGEDIFATTLNGSGTAQTNPPFTAIVASFRTDTPGRSGRGRSYMPYTGGGLDVDYEVTQTVCNSVCAGYAGLLGDLNDLDLTAAGVTSQQCVVVSSTKSTTYPINQVIVDSRVDTQRRREDQFAPLRSDTLAVT